MEDFPTEAYEDIKQVSPETAKEAANAVLGFVEWEATPEGKEYWLDVWDRIRAIHNANS
jgi:hypothetical protein